LTMTLIAPDETTPPAPCCAWVAPRQVLSPAGRRTIVSPGETAEEVTLITVDVAAKMDVGVRCMSGGEGGGAGGGAGGDGGGLGGGDAGGGGDGGGGGAHGGGGEGNGGMGTPAR
jgi:hypothetical protein